MTTFGANQPRIFPWLGFWHQVVNSKVYELAIHDGFNKDRTVFTNKTTIGRSDEDSHDLRLRLIGGQSGCKGRPFKLIRIEDAAIEEFLEDLEMTHRNSPYYREYAPAVREIMRTSSNRYWLIVLNTLQWTSELLELDTVWSIGRQSVGETVTERVASQNLPYGEGNLYIAGPSTRNYLDFNRYDELTHQPVKILGYDPVQLAERTGDPTYLTHGRLSILSLLFEFGKDKVIELVEDGKLDQNELVGDDFGQ